MTYLARRMDDGPSQLALARFWGRMAKTEPVNAEDFIAAADEQYGPHRGYLLAFQAWNVKRLGWLGDPS